MYLRRFSILVVVVLAIANSSVASATQINKPDNIIPPTTLKSSDFQLEISQIIADESTSRTHPQWIQKLNLTEEQTQRMQEIQNQYKGQIAEKQNSFHRAQQELREMIASSASPTQIRAKHREVQLLKDQLERLHLESIIAIREVLTPEQRRQFDQIMEERRENAHSKAGQ